MPLEKKDLDLLLKHYKEQTKDCLETAADFDIKDTGKIKVRDYGALKFTDKTFDPRVTLKENLNLSNVLRDTKFDKGVYRDLKEAGINVERFDAERAKLNRVDVEKMALFIDDALANAKQDLFVQLFKKNNLYR